MSITLYMDHHVPRAITEGLRLRGIDVITACLLDRATELSRVLFTQDDDLLVEATKRQRNRLSLCGVIYAHQLRVSIVRKDL
jgi:hypothetical protein